MIKQLKQWYIPKKEPLNFIFKILAIYLIFQGFYEYFLSTNTSIDLALIATIITHAEGLLTFLGYTLIESDPYNTALMGVDGTSGVIIGGPCDGLSLFILYASFLLVFKGKIWFKLIYISLGIILIHFLNVLRVVSLALIVVYSPQSLDFHHSYTFTLSMYLIIFFMWMMRIKFYKRYKV